MSAAVHAAPPRALVVAGTHSGCGKTLVSLGLMAALKQQGLTVQPFKAGPDFIDPGWHQAVTSLASHNLDGWMLGQAGVLDIFGRRARGSDIAVVEGVMGLFDGASAVDDAGSTAEIARILDADIALVVDARSMARSAAALVQGFLDFDARLHVPLLIFNRTGSPDHAALLRESVAAARRAKGQEAPRMLCLGRDAALELPSRHLGLVTAGDHNMEPRMAEALAEWIRAGLAASGMDLQGLLACLRPAGAPLAEPPRDEAAGDTVRPEPVGDPVRIGVARDAAFCFYYEENLEHLRRAGAEIVEFSPLSDESLPPGLDGLYLGGGYPELHAETLATNASLRGEVKAFAASGRPVYAECGGFMFLMRELNTDGGAYPMAGVFDLGCRMLPKRRALGYREAETTRQSLLGPPGTRLRGHEFHYSEPLGLDEAARPIYTLQDRSGRPLDSEGLCKGETLGSYVHLHWGSNPDAALAFAARCRELRARGNG